MSLPREWSLQDSRGSLHCPSESNPAGRIEYEPRGIVRAPTAVPLIDTAIVGSQPAPPSILTECQQSGSLFSIHSAPPVPLADLGIVQNDNLLGFGCTASNGNNLNGSLDPPRRPASLPIDTACCPPRTLHAGFLLHQPSEIEEDDNENLLTISSLTARPLIAKSRELRSTRLAAEKNAKGRSASKADSGSSEPPDGGYGWIVVFGAFSVQFWVAGLVKSYGVLYVEIMETFPHTSAAVASWIPAILSALCLALAPLSSALCQKFSCRTVVFIGGLFCALGLTLSYFATSLLHLLFTFGILTGIGGGLSTTPGIVIVSQYFDKHRALANGICVSGTAAGSFILPVLIEHLVHNFGFHGTILILGGCMLHVCASATLYRPAEILEEDKSIANNLKTDTGQDGPLTNSTYLDSVDERTNKKYIEHLFLEESKNRLNDYFTSKIANSCEKVSQADSDDEGKDTIGETTFSKVNTASYRGSSILHSVEDLSTDSTCVYRKRSNGFDSRHGSRRRNKNNASSVDEILSKFTPILSKNTSLASNNRGLSKSMILPTPSNDFCEGGGLDDDSDETVTCCDRIQEYLDITLLKDSTFILFCLSVTLMSVGCPYMLYYLPAHVISIGYSKSEAGYLVAASAALDLIGRLGLGWLSDLQLFDRKKTYVVCILGAGLAVLTIPFAHSIYMIGSAAATYGLCLGCWYLLMPVLLGDIFGTERMSSSFGLVRMFQSLGAVSVPPLAGFLRDLSGSYRICFYCMGTSMIMGCIPLLIWAVMQKKKGLLSSAIRDDNEDSYSVA